MLKKTNILLLTVAFPFSVYTQDTNYDCMNAHTIDAEEVHITGKGGAGHVLEISSKDAKSLYYFQKEENVFWYKFVLPADAEISFTILPDNIVNDFDFLLFEAKNDDVCDLIKDKKLPPLRSNISRSIVSEKGITGLSETGTSDFVHSGPGENYSKSLNGVAGNEYYLVLNSSNAATYGHTINLKYKVKKMLPIVSEKKEVKHHLIHKKKPSIALVVDVTDTKEGKPLNVTLEVEGIIPGKPVITEGEHHFSYLLEKRKTYKVKCIYKGFLMYSEDLVVDGEKELLELNIQLEPISEGSKFALNDIKFKPDGAYILRSSEPELKSLVKFMEKNPSTEIQINGHVNAPYMKNTSAAQKLSKDRAKAVYDFLVKRGIKKNRLSFKGFGNTEMIYPTPHSYAQERSNRRVEIEVTKE